MSVADDLRAAMTGPSGEHLYLSTSCLHGDHEHCRSFVNVEGGAKTPGTCKFCAAVCICEQCDHGAST
jgi:hypothetical protein